MQDGSDTMVERLAFLEVRSVCLTRAIESKKNRRTVALAARQGPVQVLRLRRRDYDVSNCTSQVACKAGASPHVDHCRPGLARRAPCHMGGDRGLSRLAPSTSTTLDNVDAVASERPILIKDDAIYNRDSLNPTESDESESLVWSLSLSSQ